MGPLVPLWDIKKLYWAKNPIFELLLAQIVLFLLFTNMNIPA